jgi:L-arabinose isomerase
MTSSSEQKKQELWLLTGSQHLYGDETLASVARTSREIAEALDRSGAFPTRVVW